MATDVWKFFAGLALFLYAMGQLEMTLKQLAGRTFKLFLKRHTKNKLKGILSGALVTGILQSSSVVTLIVLGFVGAGLLNMRSAFAIVLGSNLGTTFDSWIVAALGFRFNTELFALPFIAVSAAGSILFRNRQKIQLLFQLMMAAGLLFLGLGFMKDSFEMLAQNFDLGRYSHLNNLSFVFLGFVITALIQSSSATMIIVLSALNSGVIPFVSAAALIIGSELGTSLKAIIGAAGPGVEKKKVAYGNVTFNFCIVILAFCFLHPLAGFIQHKIRDPLIGLVMFQSFINFAGIVLFFPFLNAFADFMDRLFVRKKGAATHYVYNNQSSADETFPELVQKEVFLFIHRVLCLNSSVLGLKQGSPEGDQEIKDFINEEQSLFPLYVSRYAHIKQAEGEILSAYNKATVEKGESPKVNQLLSALRNAMYAAKGIKDVQQDLEELKNSGSDLKYNSYLELRSKLGEFYAEVSLLLNANKNNCYEELCRTMNDFNQKYKESMEAIYKKSGTDNVKEADISTLLNVNRELYSSGKSLIHALKNYLLDVPDAEKFDNTFGIGF